MTQFRWTSAVAIALFVSPVVADDLTFFISPGSIQGQERTVAGEGGVSLETLSDQRAEMEKSNKKQYGKKREQWPADKRAEFEALENTVRRRAFESNYRDLGGAQAKDLDASVAGLRENLAKKKGVRVAASAAEADLNVEVVGRFTGPDAAGTRAAHLGLRIKPGGKMDAALLAKSPIVWPENVNKMYGAASTPWHQYSAEQPFWLVEIEREAGVFGGMVYGKAEEHAANSFEKLAKEHAAAVVAVRRAH